MSKVVMVFDKFRENYLFKFLGNIEGKKILELGCGTGDRAVRMISLGASVTGIDVQDVVRKQYHDISGFEFRKLDAGQIAYKSEYDAIVSGDVIEHVQDDLLFVERSVAALKPGGVIVFGTPHRYRTIHLLNAMRGKPPVYPLDLGKDADLGDTIHIREYTFKMYRDVFRKAGCDADIYGYWLGLGPRFGIPFISRFPFLPYHYLFAVVTKR